MYYVINIILLIVLGLVVGSFNNVCIYRLPRKESIVYPASHCPYCNTRISTKDNIPLLSYFLLKGRCRNCKNKISLQYPVVEFLNAIIYLLLYLKYGFRVQTLVYMALSSALIIIAFIDFKEEIIPNEISLPGIVIGLMISFLVKHISVWDSALGIVTGGGAILFIALIGEWLFKKEAMGGGDIKLAAMIGAFLGWRYTSLSLFFGYLLGALTGIVLIILKMKNRGETIPFGPFIVAGSLIAILIGDKILFWYLGG